LPADQATKTMLVVRNLNLIFRSFQPGFSHWTAFPLWRTTASRYTGAPLCEALELWASILAGDDVILFESLPHQRLGVTSRCAWLIIR
jgi:hypothetical protein